MKGNEENGLKRCILTLFDFLENLLIKLQNDDLEILMDLKEPQNCSFELKIRRKSKDEKNEIWPRAGARPEHQNMIYSRASALKHPN